MISARDAGASENTFTIAIIIFTVQLFSALHFYDPSWIPNLASNVTHCVNCYQPIFIFHTRLIIIMTQQFRCTVRWSLLLKFIQASTSHTSSHQMPFVYSYTSSYFGGGASRFEMVWVKFSSLKS